jgi:hypothetical protein
MVTFTPMNSWPGSARVRAAKSPGATSMAS